jgi:hypothetical protein
MKKRFTFLIAALFLMTACKKEIINLVNDQTPHGTITIYPEGSIGDKYQYRVFCCNDPEQYETQLDTTLIPTFYIRGTIKHDQQPVTIKMSRPEFFYIIGYRELTVRQDSIYISQAGFTGYQYINTGIRWINLNRQLSFK